MVISKRKQRKVSREKLLLGNYVGPRFHVLLGDGFLPNVEIASGVTAASSPGIDEMGRGEERRGESRPLTTETWGMH